MTPLFCEVVKAGKLNADAVQRENGGGMEDLLLSLLAHNDVLARAGLGLSDRGCRLGLGVRQSDEWLALTKAIAAAQHSTVGAVGLRTVGNQTESPCAEKSEEISESPKSQPVNRRAIVDDYIREVFAKSGKRITRKDFWSKAGYRTRTEFERWERHDSKYPNKSADETFTRILREKPHLK